MTHVFQCCGIHWYLLGANLAGMKRPDPAVPGHQRGLPRDCHWHPMQWSPVDLEEIKICSTAPLSCNLDDLGISWNILDDLG